MAFEVTRKPETAEQPVAPQAEPPTLTAVPSSQPESAETETDPAPDDTPEPPKKGGRPTLTRIK
jgi:stringent starvation protein B